MKKNKYLLIRVILFMFFIGTILYITLLGFINSNDAHLIGVVRDYMIVFVIAFVVFFSGDNSRKIEEDRMKAYKDGYEQGQYDKDMEAE